MSLWRRWRVALLAMVALLAWMGSAAAAAGLLELRQAVLVTTLDGQTSPARPIELPLHWDVAFEGRSGAAQLRLGFELPAGTGAQREPQQLFITRLGNAYEIELNGVLLRSAGSLSGSHDRFSSKQPVSVLVPTRLLATHNELLIRLRADAGARAGLSTAWFGPASAVAPLAQRAELLRVNLPLATSVFSLLVACFCALLWWQQRDALYAWAGLGEALWALAVSDTVVETAPLPWPYWGLSLLLIRATWAWSLYAIAQEVFGRRPRGEFWTMLAVQAASPLCVLLMVALHSTRPLLAWYVLSFSTWAWVIACLGWQLRRQRSSERWIVWVALVAVVIASLRDVIAARVDAVLYDESAWAKYLSTLVGTALMWIVSQRFLKARAEAIHLSASLAHQVAEKELELRESFSRLSELEQSRAVLAERQRILRDMHDGVGASLATAVRQIESGRAMPADVLMTLHESIDQLKLSVDALNLPAGDVNALLASMRYRLQPRIESAGMAVRWEVDELPLWATGSSEAMRHLQFILLEVTSNALQHARASTLAFGARATDQGIEVTVSDDGRGVAGAPRNGLRSMQTRAQAIGAVVSVARTQPGTRVTVLLRSPAA